MNASQRMKALSWIAENEGKEISTIEFVELIDALGFDFFARVEQKHYKFAKTVYGFVIVEASTPRSCLGHVKGVKEAKYYPGFDDMWDAP